MLADLIAHDRLPESGLASFIRNFMAVIEIDAHRQGRLASRAELQSYTTCLASAVMDGLQYFIGNGESYPARTIGCWRSPVLTTHMLRIRARIFRQGWLIYRRNILKPTAFKDRIN